jgi:hypothetical protein
VKTSVIAILLAAYVLAAQSREKRITPVDAAQRESFSKSTNVAIVVGVSDYAPDTGLQKLQYANRDAEAVAAELRRQDYKVRLLVDGEATRSRISAAIREAGRRRLTRRNAAFLLLGPRVRATAGPQFSGNLWRHRG